MTPRDSGQSFDPKHRIIGAIVVVALAVVLVPMILGQREAPADSSAPPAVTTATGPKATPDVETKVAVTVVTPSVKSKAPTPEASAVVSAAVETVPPPKEPAKEPAKTTVAPKPTTAANVPTPAKAAVAAKAAPATSWIVQVGTFSNIENATRVEQRLRALGQTVRAERVTIQGGKAVRVRAGPFADKAAALKARDRIQKETGIKVVVLAHP